MIKSFKLFNFLVKIPRFTSGFKKTTTREQLTVEQDEIIDSIRATYSQLATDIKKNSSY